MDPHEIKRQLEELADSLDRYKPDQSVRATVGKQANILLDEMTAALPENPVVAGTPRFEVGGNIIGGATKAADVSAVLRVVASQVPRRAPSIA